VFSRANTERWQLVTSNTVVVETYALLLNRTGEGRPKAIGFLDDIDSSGLQVERVSEADEKKAIALIRSHGDKNYSLCDALGVVVCERLGITEVIACDDDFRSYGRLTCCCRSLPLRVARSSRRKRVSRNPERAQQTAKPRSRHRHPRGHASRKTEQLEKVEPAVESRGDRDRVAIDDDRHRFTLLTAARAASCRRAARAHRPTV